MNELEFNVILQKLGLNNHSELSTNNSDKKGNIYRWNNISISFSGNTYAIVSGRIPLEVANIIYQKYPNNEYGIRIDGGKKDAVPLDEAVDDKYVNDIMYDENENIGEYHQRCKNARKNFLRRADKNKYISLYHIDTKQGLVIFLTEMKDYYARKNNLPETEVQKYDEYIEDICREILNQANMQITTYDWMNADEKNRETFFNTIYNETRTSFGRSFRTAIDEFDATINPYINTHVELDDIINYKDKVDIAIFPRGDMNNSERKNCIEVHITNLESKNIVSYFRSKEGFSYKLTYKLGEKQNLSVLHYYTNISDDEKENGEVIAVSYFGDNIPKKIDIRYNITKGVAGTTYGEKTPVTPYEKEYIYDQLIKAITYAESITIDNMKKQEHVKKLLPNK